MKTIVRASLYDIHTFHFVDNIDKMRSDRWKGCDITFVCELDTHLKRKEAIYYMLRNYKVQNCKDTFNCSSEKIDNIINIVMRCSVKDLRAFLKMKWLENNKPGVKSKYRNRLCPQISNLTLYIFLTMFYFTIIVLPLLIF